jgi:hypothetical protein
MTIVNVDLPSMKAGLHLSAAFEQPGEPIDELGCGRGPGQRCAMAAREISANGATEANHIAVGVNGRGARVACVHARQPILAVRGR